MFSGRRSPGVPVPQETNNRGGTNSGGGTRPIIVSRSISEWVQRLSSSCFRILCEIEGSPTPSVHWLFNSNRLQTSRDYSATRSGLRVCNARVDVHTGTYRCVAENRNGRSYREIEIRSDHPSMCCTICWMHNGACKCYVTAHWNVKQPANWILNKDSVPYAYRENFCFEKERK